MRVLARCCPMVRALVPQGDIEACVSAIGPPKRTICPILTKGLRGKTLQHTKLDKPARSPRCRHTGRSLV